VGRPIRDGVNRVDQFGLEQLVGRGVVGADALGLVLGFRAHLAEEFAVHRSLGLDGDDVGFGVPLERGASDSHERAGGATAGDNRADPTVERLEDLGCSRLVVGFRVQRIRELLGTAASSSSAASS